MTSDQRETGGGRQFTDQQQQAIATRGTSVALSAGAGCGKTFVLTERFLAELEPAAASGTQESAFGSPTARLSQLVAITFTERAAREMRDRIRSACERRLLECPEDHVGYWTEMVRGLDSARISTIHSFCGSLLRAHAVEARLDPHFDVIDQGQAETLLAKTLDEELRNRLADRDEAVIDLVVGFDLSGLKSRIAGLLRKRHHIDWAAWREETPEGLAARWERFAREEALPAAAAELSCSTCARTVLRIAQCGPASHAAMQERFAELREKLPDLAESQDLLGDLEAIRAAARVQGGGGKKAWAEETDYEEFKNAATELRKLVEKTQKCGDFDVEAALPTAAKALQLLGVAAGVAEAYEQQKRELGVLDFDDLMIQARDLLVGPERAILRRQLAGGIRLLLVDEFQDTDPLQVELVAALCNHEVTRGKLFFVGDHKQSIYRFRGADPRVFAGLRNSLPVEGRLPLSLNFRSQPGVIEFVNALFAEELGPEYEPLQAHRPQVAPRPAVEFLWAPVEADEGGRVSEHELRVREADWIARRIRGMLDAGELRVLDGATLEGGDPAARAVRPGDVALLFRALSNVDLYEEALRRWGIDYYLVGGHAFYAQQEIYDLVNLLRTLSNEADTVSLVGVLRSPMFNLHDETLFWCAQHRDGLAGGLAAERLPAAIGDEQRDRARFAAATLADLRAVKDRLPMARLIQEALERTGYDALLLGEFLGERKLANLEKLIDQARGFDRSGVFSLDDFITQLSEFVAQQPDEPLAATCPETTDVVRLMTIHQSKGLEFPVVFVPDLDRRRRGSSTAVAFTPELGPMLKDSAAVTGFDLHGLVESLEDRAEVARLLYVATTRAADYLVLSSGVRELGAPHSPWMELLAGRFDLTGGQCLDAAYDGVQAQVTTSEPPVEATARSTTVARRLDKLVDKAVTAARRGKGRVPPHLGPVAPDLAARRQYSFSRLSGLLHRHDNGLDRELIDEGGAETSLLDPLGLGTLVHAVLAEFDFAQPGQLAELLPRHAQRHLPDAGEELSEAMAMLERFAASPRAAAMAAAEEHHRELEFLLPWPPGARQARPPYLQGFIDCLYRDADGWHLIDYKTNRVTARTLTPTAAKYEMQMLVYALAAERILGSAPVERTLVFLRTGQEHGFDFDDAARGRAVEMIDAAIAQSVGA